MKKYNKNRKRKAFSNLALASVILPSAFVLSTPYEAEASDVISTTLDSTAQKTIESSQLRVWMKDTARYGIQLKSNGAYVFYNQDSALLNILRDSTTFPTGSYSYNPFANFTVKSFTVTNNVIEQVRTDGVFDYTFRLSIINATSLGAYLKAEIEMKNLTGSQQLVGASFNADTMINGNDQSPFRIIENGWEAFDGGVQVTGYYQNVFNTTNADSIFLGHYNSQTPMATNSFTIGQEIYPGDSGAGMYYNPEYVPAYGVRKESYILGMGPRNSNPSFSMTAPADNMTFYKGQTLPIAGTVKDTDIGDQLTMKWSIDGGTENTLTTLTANGVNQSFNYNYTLPNNLSEGWHTIQVWAMDDKGGVSSSNSKQFYINNFIEPGAPTYSNVTSNSLNVAFDKKTNVASTTYELFKVWNNQTVNLGTSTTLSESGLTPNTLYQYKVRAKNTSNVYTNYSGVTSIYTLANQPAGGSVVPLEVGKATLSWGANSNPSGTKYQYSIRRAGDNVVAKSGETTSTSITVTGIPTDVIYNVYVKAVNGNNIATTERNLGQMYHDTIAPSVTLSQSSSAWTNQSVTISLNATDNLSGIKSVTMPNGNVVNASSVSYAVQENGTYTFKVTDNSGNVATKSISITNFDKQKPTATHNIEHVSGKTFTLTVNATDSVSGMKQIKLPNGQFVTGNKAVYTVTSGERYEFELEDIAGNKLTYPVQVDVPSLSLSQNNNHAKAQWNYPMSDLKTGQLYRGNVKVYEGLATSFEDNEATDKAKPNNVGTVNVSAKEGVVFMNYSKPSDNGTEYEYFVKTITNGGNTINSEKKKITISMGVDGYSYVVDKNASTIPDNVIDTRNQEIQIPITTNEKYYIHIKTIDKVGNVSDVQHVAYQDNIAPTVNLTQNPTAWTKDSVEISVTTSDSQLGVKRIKLPNGTWVNGVTTKYTVSGNGTYSFVVEDLVGNQTTKSITISNIDKTAPTASTISNNTDWINASSVPVTINSGTDSQSGVSHVEYKLEGETIKGWTRYTGTFNVSNEGITKIIARTVDNMGHISTESVSYTKLDRSNPYNQGIIIHLKGK